jgi:SPP1 gp7 family putative phage head morphogenesis protein
MPTTPPQLIESTTRHAAHLERLKSGYVKDLLPLLETMQKGIISRLEGEDISEWDRRRLNKELTAIRNSMSRAYNGKIKRAWHEQINDLADYEAGFEARNLSEVTVNYDFDLPSETQLRSAVYTNPLQVSGPDGGKLLDAFYTDWTTKQINQTAGILTLGFAQGRTTAQIVRDIRDFVGPSGQSARGLEVLARTSLQHAANQARQATWEANSDIVSRVRWVSTLDSRTSTLCRSLDGQEYPLDSGPRPPAHQACRSSTVAVLSDRFKTLEEGATRRERDPETGEAGYVPANETYYGWLKRQPYDVQESIIGPIRAKLLNDGGLSAERFAELQIGRRFEPMTLDEMRKLEPVAFQRAGLD